MAVCLQRTSDFGAGNRKTDGVRTGTDVVVGTGGGEPSHVVGLSGGSPGGVEEVAGGVAGSAVAGRIREAGVGGGRWDQDPGTGGKRQLRGRARAADRAAPRRTGADVPP